MLGSQVYGVQGQIYLRMYPSLLTGQVSGISVHVRED